MLPLDADDLLVPTAVAELVEQLNTADERVGFIYPNLQFFGNRRDYLEMPSYNLHVLLRFDLPQVAAAIAPRPLTMTKLLDAMKHPVAPPQAAEIYSVAASAYKDAGSATAFRIL